MAPLPARRAALASLGAPFLSMKFNSRHTQAQIKSAFRVHEALTHPNTEAKFGTPDIITPV
jgi:hypothetical protein